MDQNSSSHLNLDSERSINGRSPEPEISLDGSGPLPDWYGDNRLVILPRDPLCFFAYWEITHERAEKVRQQFGLDVWDRAALVLRVYDVSESDSSTVFFDSEINKQARQWYVRVTQPGRTYVVDLGLRLPDGTFISLIHSNKITLPFGRVSEKTDSQWMAVGAGPNPHEKEWERVMDVSGGVADNLGKGSTEIAKSMAQRWEFLKSVFSGSSSVFSSPFAHPPDPVAPEEKR